jgi:cyclin-dependent kinase regulatory subunit CKS1
MANMDIDHTRRNKKPRLLTDSERDKLDEFVDSIHYSSRYALTIIAHRPQPTMR